MSTQTDRWIQIRANATEIRAKFNSTCARCTGPIRAGSRVLWTRTPMGLTQSTVIHLDDAVCLCHAHVIPSWCVEHGLTEHGDY